MAGRNPSRGRGKGKERSVGDIAGDQEESSPESSRGLRRSQRGKSRASLEASKNRREDQSLSQQLPQWQAGLPASPAGYDQRSFSWTIESSLQGSSYPSVLQGEDLAQRDDEILRIMLSNAEPARPLQSPSPAGPSERLYAGGGIMPLSSPILQQQGYSPFAGPSQVTPQPIGTLASSMGIPWLTEREVAPFASAAELPFTMDPLPGMFSSPPPFSPLEYPYPPAATEYNVASSHSSMSSTSLAPSLSTSPRLPYAASQMIGARSMSTSELDKTPACDLCRRRKVKVSH
jgi:hypothetical protein